MDFLVKLISFLIVCGASRHYYVHGAVDADLITNLPGLTFNPGFRQWSGFLDVLGGNISIHYWLVESQGSPSTDPLILWLNGGPGCSSLLGFFEELGPFSPNPDGQTLFENVFSWNKVANVLFIESPQDVGYSYSSVNDTLYSDAHTAEINLQVLITFASKFPEYNGRDFYITGESYGGVYVPTLSRAVINQIKNDKTILPLNFVGFAVGNGILSNNYQVDSYIDLAFYRGQIGLPQYTQLKGCCNATNPQTTLQYCPFAENYLVFENDGQGHPKDNSQCGQMIAKFGQDLLWNNDGTTRDAYNFIEDCYTRDYNQFLTNNHQKMESIRQKLMIYSQTPIITDGIWRFIDQAGNVNTKSTDPFSGFYCWGDQAMYTYLNLPAVRAAIHVADRINRTWEEGWTRQNLEMYNVFNDIFTSNYSLKILIYDGDVDGVCNFLGDEWFVENITQAFNFNNTAARYQWWYQQQPGELQNVAGFVKQWASKDGSISLDLLTVKGAGHPVPQDRPGPALAMINNFISAKRNYSAPFNVSIYPKPLLGQYQTPPESLITRQQADQVFSLPGLTFDNSQSSFNHYSGYLRASPGNFLHYWLIGSSSGRPKMDPLIVWLAGGPGCTSVATLLVRSGPFHPNHDGETIYQNVYSWNKAANVLYISAPRNTGFSWQNMTVNTNDSYSDDQTIDDVYLALLDFFTAYPEFIQYDQKLYLAGDSYAGIFVSGLASKIVKKLQSGDIKKGTQIPTFQGIMIGNGELSAVQLVNSLIPELYAKGHIGKGQWDNLQSCCKDQTGYNNMSFCNFAKFVNINQLDNVTSIDPNNACGTIIASLLMRPWELGRIYPVTGLMNIYQDCYMQAQHNGYFQDFKTAVTLAYLEQNDNYNPYSTDGQGGFPCWAQQSTDRYLRREDTRRALHIPDYVQPYQYCNADLQSKYKRQYQDTTPFFNDVIDYFTSINTTFRILIYNGDLDFVCNHIGNQWFTENLANVKGMQVAKPHQQWLYRNQIGGYQKRWKKGGLTLDLVTVKGAGHLAPLDRPGPVQQLVTDFVNLEDDYSQAQAPVQTNPLLPQYQAAESLSNFVGQSGLWQRISSSKRFHGLKKELNRQRQEPKTSSTPTQALPPPQVNAAADDKITQPLPGQTFTFPSDMYSGYLDLTNSTDLGSFAGVHLHYWLIESEVNPTADPLILWLNGGPGCSSLGGLLNELGPFRPSRDGSKLYQNVWSWTKAGNVMFLESPRGVGFSYSDSSASLPLTLNNDEITAKMNTEALLRFFDKFPQYKNRPFYITGESYGGVYVPTLVDQLLRTIKTRNIAYINFQGFAIGNGELSELKQISSAVTLNYYRGEYDLPKYVSVMNCCPGNTAADGGYSVPCDLTQYVAMDQFGDVINARPGNQTVQQCGLLTKELGFDDVWNTLNDVYNTYQDCYNPPYNNTGLANRHRRAKRAFEDQDFALPGTVLSNKYPFFDTAKFITKDSTDGFNGFYCYEDAATATYLNNPDVQKALHVANLTWQDCNDDINGAYIQQHNDTRTVWDSIISSGWNLKILIYNGDVDMACQFLGDEWLIENLAYDYKAIPGARTFWQYQAPNATGENNTVVTYRPRLAGFVKNFAYTNTSLNQKITIDLLTVKGGGHFVPLDRPGPALQMIYNFVKGRSYNTSVDLPLNPTPLLSSYMPPPPNQPSLPTIDKVYNLPGLTYSINFNQYSGYLPGKTPGNYLHYWLVEAQRSQVNPAAAPLILWLNGGPGCSSVGGLMVENGPFHPNPDGTTLFENIYAWNKVANVLYLESPRLVGFSYQEKTQNNDTSFDDDKTTEDAAAAIYAFFANYPQYQGREFYVAGESYGGVYVPRLTWYLLDFIEKNTTAHNYINLRGMLVGNGYVSNKWDIRTVADFMYFHGLYGKTEWDQLRSCCKDNFTTYCDLSPWLNATGAPIDNSNCSQWAYQMTEWRQWMSHYDVYNIYQDCYGYSTFSFGSMTREEKEAKMMKERREHFEANKKHFQFGKPPNYMAAYVNQMSRINYASTDLQGGFQCYMSNAATYYLNQRHVREALHIPEYVQKWEFCSDFVGSHYVPIYNADLNSDMSTTFLNITNSAHVQELANNGIQFKILLYNGDVDLACGMLQAEYFVEELANTIAGTTVTRNRSEWYYSIADDSKAVVGHAKSFKMSNVKFDLLTVKGSGHMVPTDRPAPALQMLFNFLNNGDYSQRVNVSLSAAPLLPQYTPPPPNNATPPPVTTAPPTQAQTQPPTVQTTATTQGNQPPTTTNTTTTTGGGGSNTGGSGSGSLDTSLIMNLLALVMAYLIYRL